MGFIMGRRGRVVVVRGEWVLELGKRGKVWGDMGVVEWI